jgi:hypothetical protein
MILSINTMTHYTNAEQPELSLKPVRLQAFVKEINLFDSL